MEQVADAKGYCCLRGMMLSTLNKSGRELAVSLGVSHEAVYQRRRELREGKLICPPDVPSDLCILPHTDDDNGQKDRYSSGTGDHDDDVPRTIF